MTQERNRILYQLERIQQDLDYLILKTPTGPDRNALTDINIVLLMVIGALRGEGRPRETA